jgi:hypothetical protein
MLLYCARYMGTHQAANIGHCLISGRSSQVKGRRLDTDSGPRTRSRAAKQAEQWDMVSLRLKLFVLTVDALLEAQAQVVVMLRVDKRHCGCTAQEASIHNAINCLNHGLASPAGSPPSLLMLLCHAGRKRRRQGRGQ